MSQSIAGLENKRFFGAANVINKNKHFNDQFKDLISYEVVQGDTLTSIAFKHKVSLRFLMNLSLEFDLLGDKDILKLAKAFVGVFSIELY